MIACWVPKSVHLNIKLAKIKQVLALGSSFLSVINDFEKTAFLFSNPLECKSSAIKLKKARKATFQSKKALFLSEMPPFKTGTKKIWKLYSEHLFFLFGIQLKIAEKIQKGLIYIDNYLKDKQCNSNGLEVTYATLSIVTATFLQNYDSRLNFWGFGSFLRWWERIWPFRRCFYRSGQVTGIFSKNQKVHLY